MWVWEIWGACIAVSAFGELLQSVLILNWRCTVERCLDRFLFTGRWHEKRSLVSLVVSQEILESSGGLGELLGVLERPWKNLRERSRVFCEVARAILQCFFGVHISWFVCFFAFATEEVLVHFYARR